MIHNHDRSGWIGASDTAKVMGRWDTKTFERFWREKLGLYNGKANTIAMKSGTAYEGKILDALKIKKRDRQIRIPRLRLRVNLDGEDAVIHEVKTHKSDVFKVSKAYWQQAQVEMFAAGKPLVIDAYRMEAEDYGNWLREIDPCRLSRHPIEYDARWVEEEYLPRLRYLARCLKEGRWPDDDGGHL